MESSAARFLALAAAGDGGRAELLAALELAKAVLSGTAVTLAARVMSGEPSARADAVRLASIVLDRLDTSAAQGDLAIGADHNGE